MKINFIRTVCFLLLFNSCKEKDKGPAQVVPTVNVVEAGQLTVPVYAEYVGQTFGQSDVEIHSRVEGWVQSVLFKEGSTVSKGQLLYVVQDNELKDRERVAQARLSEANILLVKAKSDLDRVKPLAEMNALSKRDLDAAQAAYDAQREAVHAAQAVLSNSRTQLSYARITAPITGTIGVSKVQVGDYVKNIGETPLNTISAVGSMRVRFSVTENDYLMHRQKAGGEDLRNANVDLILNDGSVFPEKAKIDFANREIDPATGSLLLQAVVENKSRLLRPGQYVKVRVKTDEIPNAVLVPQQAINQMQNMHMAFVVNDSSKINPRPVKTGMRVGSNWVITEGLKPGEKVALVGNAIIKPGMVIKPVVTAYSYDSSSAN
ncbi:efflux RND transporter periplasmic adaptor subunit [Chitinophagaceae bacterium LB-8]|jgi:membrane fusion protein, multidrug efflux system|uniref:Efflux RND transporter periplasmic adaptor subunit n=1 Tax=Paraflavisolibacter caeni TaxID=2982496 RepID=A0A9X3BIE1_9BACT|nr:efflux RND transporter periplasmic adaptor subunit [Paraflavisolibacter caeni]MCU7549923.1 efflux RND transporter periplasmic adaptor subunit [Paraflavisolibacter caeni]